MYNPPWGTGLDTPLNRTRRHRSLSPLNVTWNNLIEEQISNYSREQDECTYYARHICCIPKWSPFDWLSWQVSCMFVSQTNRMTTRNQLNQPKIHIWTNLTNGSEYIGPTFKPSKSVGPKKLLQKNERTRERQRLYRITDTGGSKNLSIIIPL